MAWHRFQPNDRTFLKKIQKRTASPTPRLISFGGYFYLEWFMSITAWPLNNVCRLNRPQFFSSRAPKWKAKSQCRMIQSRSPCRCRWFLLSIRLERIIFVSNIFFHTPFIIKFIALVREKEFFWCSTTSHPKAEFSLFLLNFITQAVEVEK